MWHSVWLMPRLTIKTPSVPMKFPRVWGSCSDQNQLRECASGMPRRLGHSAALGAFPSITRLSGVMSRSLVARSARRNAASPELFPSPSLVVCLGSYGVGKWDLSKTALLLEIYILTLPLRK